MNRIYNGVRTNDGIMRHGTRTIPQLRIPIASRNNIPRSALDMFKDSLATDNDNDNDNDSQGY